METLGNTSDLRSKIKGAIYAALAFLGVVALWRYKNRHNISILTFHGVMDESIPNEWTPLRGRVSIQEFRRFLVCLKKHYKFVDIDRAVSILSENELPINNALVLTFDDGYRNNFQLALPIMRELNVPAVFYVPTAHVETNEPFWFDRLDFAYQEAMRVEASMHSKDHSAPRNNPSVAEMVNQLAHMRRELKRERSEDVFRAKVETAIATLEKSAVVKLIDLKGKDIWSDIVTWPELRSASRDPLVTIGSHSVSHTRLACEANSRVAEEVTESKRRLEHELGMPCNHLAYPNGAYNNTVKEYVREAGYCSAATSEPGMNKVGCGMFSLKRIYLPTGVSEHELLARVAGIQRSVSKIINAFSSIKRRLAARRHHNV